jgi:vancomycin permeability regulator SanA
MGYILIESKAFRHTYYLLIAAIISVMINVLISDILGKTSGQKLFLSVPFMTFHLLVFVIFTASIIKSATQIFYYQRGVKNEKLSNSE